MRLPAIRTIARLILLPALLVGALMTFAEVLAPLYPPADFANHFRPYTLAGTGALLLAALVLRARSAGWASTALAVGNAALVALPLLWSAATTEPRAVGQAQAAPSWRDLKIITFNMHYGNVAPTVRFILEEDPDIVLLQEVGDEEIAALRPLLQARYPHSHACTIDYDCGAAIFSKTPWVEAGHELFTDDGPELIWAQFDDTAMGKLRIVGVHAALPFDPSEQIEHTDRLIKLRAAHAGPMIIAGDFNMTPWSHHLRRLLASADLRRHATFLRSWPTDHQFRLLLPAFLIDHVLSSPEMKTVSIKTGPNLGSDHLPVVAVLRRG